MTLLAPWALLLGVLAVPVILMYVLRLRRPEWPISSVVLWRSLLEDMQANAPWQRLRLSALLLLQLLAIAALVLAVAHPAYSQTRIVSGDVIVILDESPSMLARDVSPSRFAAAQARARSLTSELAKGSVMSVIGMGAQPHLVIADSSDSSAIDAAIDGLAAGATPPNVLATLTLASSLARLGEPTRIVLITDHSSGIGAPPLSLRFPIEIVRIGGLMRDLGIVAFAVQPGASTRAVIRVRNFGRDLARSDLQLFADGHLADVRPLAVAGGQQDVESWTSLPGDIRSLHAVLTRHDDMQFDKSAWAVVQSARSRRVLLVTPGDYFLQTALSVDPSVHLQVVPPEQYDPTLAPGADIVVFDGVTPRSLPTVPTLLVGPTSAHLNGIRIGASRRPGPLSVTGAGAALLQYSDLSGVHVARVRDVRLPSGTTALARSSSMPVIAAGNAGGHRVAIIGFRLQESDWPLSVSFPIMIDNLLSYLAPGPTSGTTAIDRGQTVPLAPPPGTHSLEIKKPNGSVDRLVAPFVPFTDTVQPGLYTIRTLPGAAATQFAVNTFAPRQPDTPGPALLHFGHQPSSSAREVPAPTDLGWIFGLLALLLLSTEWIVASRR